MRIFESIFEQNKVVFSAVLVAAGLCLVSPRAFGQDEITLQVNFVGGGDSIDFGRMRNLEQDGRPITESATRQVRLSIQPVAGNTKPYTVTQIVTQEPTQQDGASIKDQSIFFRVEQETGTGNIRVPEQTPLVFGEQEIFRSEPTGGPTQLLITYDLSTQPDQQAGSYSGTLDYRVSTI